MKKRVILFLSALAILFVLSNGVSPTVYADQSFDVEKAIATGNHKSLADYYQTQAALSRQTAEKHKNRAKVYIDFHEKENSSLSEHCSNLSHQATAMAIEYDKLVQEEEKLANKQQK